MTSGDQEPQAYEFDIAVSFAGEDREYVQDVVDGVKAMGHTVFYDEDYAVESWGEDGVDYFTNVYQHRARFVVMFISRHYAEKMWTNLERRSALARAVTQRSAYILPVRLDDTQLEGLLPTTLYLNANRIGLSGLVEAIKMKVSGTEPARLPSVLDDRVPRSKEAIEALVEQRAACWEFRLHAALIKSGIEALEDKYRDHKLEYGARSNTFVDRDNLIQFGQTALADVLTITANFEAVLSNEAQEAAFGRPGEPGDVDKIIHLAGRFVSNYEDFLDWAARIRGASVNGEHGRAAMRLLAQAANDPIETIRQFVDEYVAEVDTFVERTNAGEHIRIVKRLQVDMEEGLMERFHEELTLAVTTGD